MSFSGFKFHKLPLIAGDPQWWSGKICGNPYAPGTNAFYSDPGAYVR